jgi:hypothetical protein
VNGDSGSIRESNGDVRSIAFHNAGTFAGLTYPYAILASALNNQTANIHYLGVVTNNGRSLYRIRVQSIPAGAEPSGMLHKFSRKDFFVDTETFQIASTLDMVHPENNFDQEFPHEVRFSDYRIVNGIPVPFECEERINGQHTWTLRLTNFQFNTGLIDTAFQF